MTRSLLFAGFVLASALATTAAPVPKGGKRTLLFVSAKTGTPNVFTVSEDGKNATNLTNSKANNSYASWSPDGTKVAFSSDRAGGGVWQVFVMDADGKNVKQVTKGTQPCRVPVWSPDGNAIAFCRPGTQGTNICTVPAAGGDVTELDGDAWDPAYSPDGKKFAFVSYRDGDGFRLYTMDADGKNAANIHPSGNTLGNGYPTWSPDGKRIAWGHGSDNNLELHAIDPDGKNVVQLTKNGGWNLYPSYSPDGKRIAFVHVPPGQKGSVRVMDADGSNQKTILADEGYVEGGRPMWKP